MTSSYPNSDLVIVVGGFVNGLGLVRSLSVLGRRIIVITTQPFDIAQYSRYVYRHYHVEELDRRPERLAGLLESRSDDWNGAHVIPTNDEALASLDMQREMLQRWYRLAIPPAGCVPYLLDRRSMLEAASAAGMALPVSYGPATAAAVSNKSIHYPVVIKPVRSGEFSSRLGRKLLECSNPADLDRHVRGLENAGLSGEIFDLVPGPDSEIIAYCVYIDKRGRPAAECSIRKLRQSPPFFGGARVARLTATPPGLCEQSLDLLRQIGFRGFAALEFKRDARDDTYRFFEVNGRSVIYNTLLRKSGLDIAALTLADDDERGPGYRVATPWPGAWIHLHADLLRSLQNWRSEKLSIRQYLAPYGAEKTFAVFSAKDPKPFLMQWARSLKQAITGSHSTTAPQNLAGDRQA